MSEIHSGASLPLAAAPTFAMMALTTGIFGGGPDNQYIYMDGAATGTLWRFNASYPANRAWRLPRNADRS